MTLFWMLALASVITWTLVVLVYVAHRNHWEPDALWMAGVVCIAIAFAAAWTILGMPPL